MWIPSSDSPPEATPSLAVDKDGSCGPLVGTSCKASITAVIEDCDIPLKLKNLNNRRFVSSCISISRDGEGERLLDEGADGGVDAAGILGAGVIDNCELIPLRVDVACPASEGIPSGLPRHR